LLTQQFQVPAENLTSQGYGKQYLKEQTDGPSRINRRVTIRRITPLLNGGTASLRRRHPASHRRGEVRQLLDHDPIRLNRIMISSLGLDVVIPRVIPANAGIHNPGLGC